MKGSSVHRDVEYQVEAADGEILTFNKFDAAAAFAVAVAAARGESAIDVLVWSRAGARFFGGDYAASEYDEDPDASIFQRIEIKVNNLGRIP